MKTTRILASMALAIGLVRGASAELPPGWHATSPGGFVEGSALYHGAEDFWTGNVLSMGCPVIPLDPLDPLDPPEAAENPPYGFFVYTDLNGDGEIIANLLWLGDPYLPEIGVMVGEDLSDISKSATMSVDRWGRAILVRSWGRRDHVRRTTSSGTDLYHWIRMKRAGDTITGYRSRDGKDWEPLGSCRLPMSTHAIIGFFAAPRCDALGEFGFAVAIDVNTVGGTGWTVSDANMCSAVSGNVGIGITKPAAKLDVLGRIRISDNAGNAVLELGKGLDYAEGFNVAEKDKIGPGSVLVIDPTNPGKLRLSAVPYDKKVAGIVAGAKGLGLCRAPGRRAVRS